MSMKTQLYINGKFVDSLKGGKFPTYNPATDELITEVASAAKEDVDLAVAAAKSALNSDSWGFKSTGHQRAVILRKMGEIMEARKEEIAKLDSLDQGKPLRESLADMSDAITAAVFFANLAEELDKKQYEAIDNGTNGDFETKILYEPIGVIGAITPWNYPFLMGIWKVIPAIAAGCTMVLKPSELAPLSCLLLAEIATQAGLPDGALNVVPGWGVEAGAALSNNDEVDKLSFTGSAATGRRIMTAAAMGPRGVSLELGGKSPLIVFEDSDIDGTVDWIITGILWGSGQVCSATSRVYLHSSIKDKILARLLERIPTIKIGNSLGPELLGYEGASMGPVVSRAQYDKIWAYIDEAKAAGITVLYGGDRKMVESLGKGYFIPPTVFVDVPTNARIWKEEIFGPVLSIRTFETEEEAVRDANDSEFGLAAAVFSADLARCARVTRNLRVGVVWENCCQPAFVQCPWGGCKKSGFGRELGRWGLEEFTSVKQVTSTKSGFQWSLW